MSGEDILQVLAVYQQRLAEFKREMEALGIKVQVSASLGKWTSTVEEVGNKTIKAGQLLDKLETAFLKANIPEEKWKVLKELRGLLAQTVKCPNCGYLEWTTVTRHGKHGNKSIVDVGYRCDRCGHEWGFEYFKEEVQEDREDTIVKIVANGHLGPFRRTYTITAEEEERSVKLIMRDFISYVIRGRRACYKKALDVLVELQKIEEKEGIKVYKDPVLERCDQRWAHTVMGGPCLRSDSGRRAWTSLKPLPGLLC